MQLVALLVTFFVLMFLGIPVALTMLGSSLVYILLDPSLSLALIATKLIGGVSGYSLLALPLYVMTGEIMNTAGITRRLFNLPLSFIGHVKGGMAHVNILASMLFAGMSGAAIADTAGLGKIEMKAMKDEGYDVEFSAAITAASSTIGPIIPPSTTMIVYATVAEVSVARLFMGGLLPGVIMGILLMLYVTLIADRKHHFPTRPKASAAQKWVALKEAALPLLTPILIIMGIVSGITTATEAGAVAMIYSVALCYYYNRFSFKDFLEMLRNAFITTVQICFIVIASALFGWVITVANVPSLVGNFLLALGASKWLVLLLINLCLLFMGCFLSITSSILIATPTLAVLASLYHIDMVHLGVMMTLNLTIGLLTPPVGWNLYIVSGLANISFEKMVKAIMPLLIPLLLSLLLITYFDQSVLWLPNLLFR
jgi:tripartite ATP-independent transporter DctM subunit